ncbi:MAG: hypothetical protein WC438_06290 [Candidatus Pacearchaeota archaeon]
MKIQKYRIKKGATVGQDFSFFSWPDKKKNLDMIFILDEKFSVDKERRVKLIADGYGILKDNKYHLSGEYGNGSLYVSSEDIIPVVEKEEEVRKDKTEKIICAAVLYKRKIYRGHRHCHAIQAMNDELSWKMSREKLCKINYEQGFITTENRFVLRKEAADIAFKTGQIKEKIDDLYSENLY